MVFSLWLFTAVSFLVVCYIAYLGMKATDAI